MTRTFLRDVALIGRFELAEAVRSKLLMVMVILFVGAGAVGAWQYTELLGTIEENAAKMMNAPQTRKPGAMARGIQGSTSYRDMIRRMVSDDRKADYYASVPPIVLFFGWVSMMFTPWLVLFTSAETIATEVAGRGIRYSLMRTGRLQYALGKMAGQSAIVAGVTALSAIAFFVVAWIGLGTFDVGPTAVGMLSYWPRILVATLPFLAWAMFASMVTASVNMARIVSLAGAVGLAIISGLAHKKSWRTGPVSESLLDGVGFLTPFGHTDGLSYPPGGEFAQDLAVCLALTVVYFAAGFAILRKRDV